ncbi:MAG: PLP-dependent aminotransferase family protein [Paracoccaceae bacterium]
MWHPDLSLPGQPKYLALAGAIATGIVSKQLSVGERLPPVRDLAWQLHVTPGTVARAYAKLVKDGLLEAVVGRGTFVAKPMVQPDWAPADEVNTSEPEMIELVSPMLPDVGQDALIRRCYAKLSQMPNQNLLRYPSQTSEVAAKRAIYRWLNGVNLGPFEAEDIVLAHGGQDAIMLILQSILKGAEPVILTEELSYAGFRRGAQLLRARVVGVECDQHGVRPDKFELACKEHGAQVLCTSPEVHNPTTVHTGQARRQEIAEVARRYYCHILEDDCYQLQESGLPRYRELLPELGWYVSSLSKSLTPSLRVGFALAPRAMTHDLKRAARYNHFGLAVPICDVTEMLLNSAVLPDMRQELRAQVNSYIHVAVNVLGGFDLKWRKDVPFLWLKLPQGWRTTAFCRAAEQNGVRVRPADDFALLDGRAPHAVRITINGRLSLPVFEKAVSVLLKLLDNPDDDIEI